MPTPDRSTAPTEPNAGAAWLSVRDAAAALGISSKTVWRRARAGELTARKVASERGGKVWEIALEPSGQTDRPTGQSRADTDRPTDAQAPEIEREPSGQTERIPTGQADKASGQTDAGAAAQFTAHLIEENKFLRATVEQLQRDGAEVRAALREAQKQNRPQLTAGESSTIEPTPANRQQREQTGAAGNDSHGAPNGSETGIQSAESGKVITYDSIADELEAMLSQRK